MIYRFSVLITCLLFFLTCSQLTQRPTSNQNISASNNSTQLTQGDLAPSNSERPIPPVGSCQSDSDCVLVSKACCPCNSGGKSVAVAVSDKESYETMLNQYCSAKEPYACATVDYCDSYKAQCRDSKCVAQ